MGFRLSRKLLWRIKPQVRVRQQHSSLERQFLARWIALGGPHLEPQFQFHPSRKWAFDWAHPTSRVAMEIHGGVWIGGRHVRGLGFAGDRLKVNAALRLNWKVFELTTGDLADDRVYAEIMDEIARRAVEGVPDRTGLIPLRDVYVDHRKSREHRRGTAK
jgi:hypothetical protein